MAERDAGLVSFERFVVEHQSNGQIFETPFDSYVEAMEFVSAVSLEPDTDSFALFGIREVKETILKFVTYIKGKVDLGEVSKGD